MNKLHKYFFIASRIFVGIIFIYSGFVKCVDPLGSTYKFSDYFNAFGAEWATIFSFGLSLLMSMAEFVVGFSVLLGLRIKLSALGALIFMVIFTPLTLVLALTNPVSDCGCFGDALILTNWQTFWKNVIILIPTIYLFIKRKKYESKSKIWEQWLGVAFGIVSIAWISMHSYNHLPVLDFRPYSVGTYIPDGMSIPEGAPADEWESIFIYSKNGEEKEFSMDNLPDSTWTFVDAQHQLIKKGYEPPIHDFTIVDEEGIDITDIVLASDNYNFLLVSYNVAKASPNNNEKLNELYNYCYEMGYPFYALTASINQDIKKFIDERDAMYEFYTSDETTLKTIIRSNPGLLVLKGGTIIDKWHINDLPSTDEIKENLMQQSISKYKNQADKYYIYSLILLGAFLIALYILLRKNFASIK